MVLVCRLFYSIFNAYSKVEDIETTVDRTLISSVRVHREDTELFQRRHGHSNEKS